jgi:hypothetical protein
MKIKLNYLFILLLIASGCSKQSVNTSDPINPLIIPVGNFSGYFTLIHLNPATNKLDTGSAFITLAMTTGPSYSVAGDTTKIQDPSYGSFTADGTLITFVDQTVTKRTPLNTPKKHLNGPYLYTYDGTNLHIYGSSDTLNYNYVLQSY